MKMRATPLKAAVIAAALALTAGCSKKAPKELPPPAEDGTGTTGDGTQDGTTDPGGVGSEALPGSRADFLQTVGQAGDRVFFDTDQYDLDGQDRATLDAQAAWLLRHTAVRVTIEGHADERGTREYNLALGDRRANAAKNYLAARGVSTGRMTVISYGKERPEALGSDESAWAQNRRAVTVLPD
ncbi:MAG TPA: peptidoglycan-associated lipoprotein Pal [Allosphingosinicella sp.]